MADVQTKVRLDADLKEAVKAAASASGRSLNGEINSLIREALGHRGVVAAYLAHREPPLSRDEVARMIAETIAAALSKKDDSGPAAQT